jgi:molybdopterin/thiamine biosynthesis adenylyltransferase
MKPYAIYLKSAKYLAEGIISHDPNESLTDRQERILGFNQSVMDNLRVVLIGAGGLGGEIAQGLARKGVGSIKIFDGDTITLSNLSRQFFTRIRRYALARIW